MATTEQRQSISLHGASSTNNHTSAFLVKLNDSILKDLKTASRDKDGLRFVTGATPKLRIGGRSIDLTISADAFRTELFASTLANSSSFNFSGVVTHRVELQNAGRTSSQTTAGTDAALAALQSNLASIEQEKQANRTNFTNTILPAPKSRFEAARKEKSIRKNGLLGSLPPSPALTAAGTSRSSLAPTSAPMTEDDVRLQAMKRVLVHLLASEPSTKDNINKKTHIPSSDLNDILRRCGKEVDGKWQLSDRAYRDLDVWKFDYPSEESRKSAIDRAVKAYDRMRLGKDEQLWQMLLPKEERGKGKVLSRLHLGAGPGNSGLTPSYQPSPAPHLDATSDSRAASAANTPRLGATTPRPGSSQGVVKRLLSKNPQRARAAEDMKEKKRKDREAAASDREGGRAAKKQATHKNQANMKSAEFVHSSEDSSDEVPITSQVKSGQGASTKPKPKPRERPGPAHLSSPDSGDAVQGMKTTKKAPTPARPKPSMTTMTTTKQSASPALTGIKQTASPMSKATKSAATGKATPLSTHNLSAPSSHHKSQRSPQKQDTRPSVPSPLGAARPRVASDVSERGATSGHRVRESGADTPKGLGITNGINRSKANTSTAKVSSEDKHEEDQNAGKPRQQPLNGAAMTNSDVTNGTGHATQNGVKRKAQSTPSRDQVKHRKTDSTSSQSQNHGSDSSMVKSDTPRTSPDAPIDGSGSDSAASVIDSLTYNQGVAIAEKFIEDYYPVYTKLYDEQAAAEARGEQVSKAERTRLLSMHRRLEQMKREMSAASKRDGVVE